jgi:predicted ChrR family anti-sigma factor
LNPKDVMTGEHSDWPALYCAGAMANDEHRAFDDHLEHCDECRARVEELGTVVAALAESAPAVAPDPRTRDALLAWADASPQVHESPLSRHLAKMDAAGSPGLHTQRSSDSVWEKSDVSGVSLRVLNVDREQNQFVAMVRMAAGSSYPRHVHRGSEQCLVLEGDLHVGEEVLGPGDYQKADAGSLHGIQFTTGGCLLLITSSLSDEFA